jgi:uncharacterized membrane protein YdbT with pleckstrin-like domain
MDLHPSEHILFSGHPSWRATLGFYLKGVVAALVVGAVVWFAAGHGVGIGVAVALVALVVLGGFLKRMSTHYVVTNERLHIRRGVLARKTQETRVSRVQNVNTSQSVLERMLGVGTVDFDTAGTDDADFTFRGIADPATVVQEVDRAQREASAVDAPPRTAV